MSSPEEIFKSLAGKVNQLRGLYGFDKVKYFTSPSHEDVFLHLSNQEGRDCGVTAHMGLKDGCFGIRSCPVFHNRVDLLGRRESKADLSSQVIKWFQDNSAKLHFSHKEEKLLTRRSNLSQLDTTDNNNGRGMKRVREEDTDTPDGDVDVPRKLSKQGRKRAARRSKVMAILADSQG
ncbi:uncharacterized protein Bfra_012318 [Botrytis fragariae]|uniref:Uncharacterized protein n=1 Tax=Botrytis fragariae TaxID=1964551 RepID=A0A8H6AJX4_9HELO|nr:uncharacterized protein Bfra_012318 [Botrytis fragariae]KAF5868670.1 hypothetical protein Bfra_012318 [Botrytis fragariae]